MKNVRTTNPAKDTISSSKISYDSYSSTYLFFVCFREVPLLHDPLVWSKAAISGGHPLLRLVECGCEVSEPVHYLITRPTGT